MDDKIKSKNKILEKIEERLIKIRDKYTINENFSTNIKIIEQIKKDSIIIIKTNILLLEQYMDMVNKIFGINKTTLAFYKKELIKANKPKKLKYDNTFSDKFKGEDTEFSDFKDLILKILDIQPIYYDDIINMWWLWDNNKLIWRTTKEERLLRLIHGYVNDIDLTTKSTYKNEIINHLKREAADDIRKPFPPNENWIQFGTKIVDVKTLKTYKPTPKFFITNIIPWELGKSKKTPVMDKLFKDWVVKENIQDSSYIKTLYQITAYTMLSYGPMQKLIALTGSGANGKSTYVKILRKLFEKDEFNKGENITSTTIYDLTRNFESSTLHKKLLCLISEVNSNEMKFTNLLKSLSGEDPIRFEFKGKDTFTDINTCAVLITANTLPKTYDTTDGFYRRWLTVDFPNKFTGKRDIIAEIPDEEFSNLCFKSITILNEMLKEGKFENEGDLEEQIRKYESKSSPINMFLQECCGYDLSEKMTIENILYWVNWFFDKNKIGKITENELIAFLKKEGYSFTKNMVKGIKLKETNDVIREQFRRQALIDDKIRREKDKIARDKYINELDKQVDMREMSIYDKKHHINKYDEDKKEGLI